MLYQLADTNGDGELTPAELRVFARSGEPGGEALRNAFELKPHAWREVWDSIEKDPNGNGDGKISMNEFVEVYVQRLRPQRPTEIEIEILHPGDQPLRFATEQQQNVSGYVCESCVMQWDVITIEEYNMYTNDGNVLIDSSANRSPVEFSLAQDRSCGGKFIAGWEETLPGMAAGQHTKLVIPAHKAFGSQGLPGQCPPDADLVAFIKIGQIIIREPSGSWAEQLGTYRQFKSKGKISDCELKEIHLGIVQTQMRMESEAAQVKFTREQAENELKEVAELKSQIERCKCTLDKAIKHSDTKMINRSRMKLAILTEQCAKEEVQAAESIEKAGVEELEATDVVKESLALMVLLLSKQLRSKQGVKNLRVQLGRLGIATEVGDWANKDKAAEYVKTIATSMVRPPFTE